MEMRILVAFDRDHHVYGDAIAQAIEACRPQLDVSVAGSQSLAAELSRTHPDVVISDRPKVGGGVTSWVELPTDPDPVSRICIGGRCRRSRNPSFTELLAVVDEAESLPA